MAASVPTAMRVPKISESAIFDGVKMRNNFSLTAGSKLAPLLNQ